MTFVPLSLLSIRSLTVITYVLLAASMVPLVLGIAVSEWRVFAGGLVLALSASWLDRWLSVRLTQARFGILLRMWHDDVAAVQEGRPRPDLTQLDISRPDLIELPKPRRSPEEADVTTRVVAWLRSLVARRQ